MGFIAVQHGDGVAAAQVGAGGLHGFKQIALVEAVDEVDDDFGVGLAGEAVAPGLKASAQLFMVFDDAVVHQRDAALGVIACLRERPHAEVRMGVVNGGCAVCGPARVRDAGAAVQVFGLRLAGQIGHARDAAHPRQPAPGMHGHAAGVVPPVFQPLQALYQQAHDVARRNRAYDAAHVFYPFERVRCEGAMLGSMR